MFYSYFVHYLHAFFSFFFLIALDNHYSERLESADIIKWLPKWTVFKEPKFPYSQLYTHGIQWQCCNTHLLLLFYFWRRYPPSKYLFPSFHMTMISTIKKEKLKGFKHFTLIASLTLPVWISASFSTESKCFLDL